MVVATSALLLRKRGLCGASRWATYIDSLPWDEAQRGWRRGIRDVHTPTAVLSWSTAKLERLRGTTADEDARVLQAKVGAATDLLRSIHARARLPFAPGGGDGRGAAACARR